MHTGKMTLPMASDCLIILFLASLLLCQSSFLPCLFKPFLRQRTAGIQKSQADCADAQKLFACHLLSHY